MPSLPQEVLLIFSIFYIGYFWSLPWKGVALWMAGKREHKTWFVVLFILGVPVLFLHLFAIPDILYIFVFSRKLDKKQNRKVEKTKEDK